MGKFSAGLFLLFCLLSAAQAEPAPLRIAVNIGPPWAYYHEQQGVVGIDVDIIRSVLNQMGYDAEFHLLGYHRVIKEFNDGKFDIASPAAFPSDLGYRTSTYLPFQDVAVTLESNDLTLSSISDLKGKRIIGYQFATSVLGEDFANVVKEASYMEEAQRELQLTLLVNHRTDVVIGERRLLTYIMKTMYPEVKLRIHPLFKTTSYGAIFKDEKMQKQFDKALLDVKTSGAFEAIFAKWN